jgi:AcrR family transcriptional regulator
MSAPTRTPRERWVEEGLRALASGGPDAVRIESLAQALDVSKGGFYWAFGSRRALLEEMLDSWERAVIDAVIERVETGGGDAKAKLARLFALASTAREFEGLPASIARNLMEIELAIRDWARRDPSIARRLKRVDNRRMDYMRSLFGALCADEREVEVRSTLAFALFIGAHFLAADHRGRSRANVVESAREWLLESQTA